MSRIIVLILLLILSFNLVQVEAFIKHPISGQYGKNSFLKVVKKHRIELLIDNIVVPKQENIENYETLLKDKLKDKQIVRWYIAQMNDVNSMLEIVFENPLID